jgi:hypothetical protein
VGLRFSADRRLAAAAAASAEFLAQRIGMELGPRAAFVAAVEEACKCTFRLLEDAQAEISVNIAGFPDRVEATIDYNGAPLPSVGLETFAVLERQEPSREQPVGLMLLTLVDRVGYATERGRQRMTLVKVLQPPDQ